MVKSPTSLALAAPLTLAALLLGCRGGPPAAAPTAHPAAPPPVASAPAATVGHGAQPVIGDTPAVRPASVVAELTVLSPRALASKLAPYADQATSGAGLMFGEERLLELVIAQLTDPPRAPLAGVDFSRPLRVVIDFAEGRVNGVLVVGVADEAALKASAARLHVPGIGASPAVVIHRGSAAIGAAVSLRRSAAYALNPAAPSEDRHDLAMTIYTDALRRELPASMADVFAEIAVAMLVQELGPQNEPTARRAIAGLDELSRVDFAVDAERDAIQVAAALRPQPGGALARFVAAQRATDFAFVDLLRPGPWQVVAAGAIDWGDLAGDAAKVGFGSRFPPALLGAVAAPEWSAVGVRDLAPGALRVSANRAAAGAPAVLDAWAHVAAARPVAAAGGWMAARTAAIRARRGRFYPVTTTLEGDGAGDGAAKPPEAGFIGVTGDHVLRGEGPPGQAARWLRAEPRRADLGAAVERGLAQARTQRRSAVILIDLVGAKQPTPAQAAIAVAAGVGPAADRLELSLVVPAAQLGALLK